MAKFEVYLDDVLKTVIYVEKDASAHRIVELESALKECLEVWERNHLENHVPGGRYIDDIVRGALAPTGESRVNEHQY